MSTAKEDKNAIPKKGGKAKKIIVIGVAGVVLIGAGVGAGIYATGLASPGHGAVAEDPNRPKLVERSEEPKEVAAEGEGEEGKAPPLKVGTVSVGSDTEQINPKKYEATYFPIAHSFTANLAGGTGFVQMSISLSTYFDGKVINNIQRQSIPIQSAILMVLSDQDAALLATPAGKQALQRQLTRAINQVLREKEGFGGIENVYFTSLVIQ
jgi:flagellar protein FliL